MGRTYLFVVLNAILLFARITNSSAQGPQPQPLGRLLTPEEGCGISEVASTRIVGGAEAKPGEYPWMALLFYLDENSGELVPDCGGTLITSRHVLTAAHCIRPELFFVRLGEHNLTTTKDGMHQDIYMARIIKHPKYNGEFSVANDLAVLTLMSNVKFNDRIRPICLPLSEELQSKNFVGKSPFIAGWGDLDEQGAPTDVLMHVQVPVIDNAQCEDLYKKEKKLWFKEQFGDSTLCAGYLEGGKDSCHGDSGGPLMLPILDNGTFNTYQIGIISYGFGCARKNAPGVYTKVEHFMNWIQKTINQK